MRGKDGSATNCKAALLSSASSVTESVPFFIKISINLSPLPLIPLDHPSSGKGKRYRQIGMSEKNRIKSITIDFYLQPLPAQLDNFRKDSGTGSFTKQS